MSLMRSSSVWLVFSTCAYQLSLAEMAARGAWAPLSGREVITGFLVGVFEIGWGKKKPPEFGGLMKALLRIFGLRESLSTAKGA
jgi:hypothetical protein